MFEFLVENGLTTPKRINLNNQNGEANEEVCCRVRPVVCEANDGV